MSQEISLTNSVAEIIIPSFREREELILPLSKTRESEQRMLEARVVNPASYSDLEYMFNESYRELKHNLTAIRYEKTRAEKAYRDSVATALLDNYPEYLKSSKIKDSAGIRDAYLTRDEECVLARDRIDMLNAFEELLDGKIKVAENICRYMKKQMDLLIRSGVSSNHYMR